MTPPDRAVERMAAGGDIREFVHRGPPPSLTFHIRLIRVDCAGRF